MIKKPNVIENGKKETNMADLVFPYLLQKSPSTTLASQMSMVTRLSHILTTLLRMDTK